MAEGFYCSSAITLGAKKRVCLLKEMVKHYQGVRGKYTVFFSIISVGHNKSSYLNQQAKKWYKVL